MRYIKIITSIILTVVLTFGVVVMDPIEVMATLPNVPGAGTTYVPLPLISLYETLRDGINDGGSPLDFIKEAIKNSGFLSPEIPALDDLSSLDQYIGRKEPNLQGETPEETAQNVGNYLINNVSVSENSITFNDNSKNFTKNIIDDYVTSNPSIGYTYLLSEIAQRISYADVYNALKQYIADADDIQGNVFVVTLSGLSTQVIKIPNATMVQDSLYVQYGNIGTLNGYRYSQGSIMSLNNNLTSPQFSYVQFNNSTKTFEPAGNTYAQNFQLLIDNVDPAIQVGSNQTKFIVSKKYRVGFKIFHSTPTVSDYMYSPYYYNNNVWEDFSTSSGDYTFSPSNVNTVTYGDTVTYIDNYNDDHGYPPSIPDININIENENNNNLNGGSGSGGNGSGGNGSGDGDSNIFDWLKSLGAVLGNLIKGLGEFLTEIVSGLVTAITSLLESLSGLVSGVLESLTNIFSGLITFLYDGLPNEVKSVLTLGLTVALLITVIRLIRGN